MNIMYQFIVSFFATIGFAIFFNAPLNTIAASGLSGATSWIIFFIGRDIFNSIIAGTFFGALSVGIIGEILAIKYKKPATVFITPGIVSLVPGAGMYYTMLYLIDNDYYKAINYGAETFFVAAAIAMGILVSTIFSRSIKSFKKSH